MTKEGSAGGNTGQIAHHIHELSVEDEERLGNLFKQLDVNGDGRIDIHDLSVSLRRMGIHQMPGHAQKFIERSDQNKSGDLTLAEFVYYVLEHEKKLKLVFSSLDHNKDGRLDLEEIYSSLHKLGLQVDRAEAKRLLQRMDKDGTLEISYGEWRDYLLFHPSSELHDILQYWRHSTYLDIGEDLNVPDDFSAEELQQGLWWRHLLAGGVAGAVSRTATAPLDRLKVFLQVHGKSHFCSIQHCLRHMLNEGGVRSLWRGNGINVLKIAPESALKFMAYEYAKRALRGDRPRDISIYERFAAGSFAGGFSQTVIYPMEVLKTRLALRRTGQYKGMVDAAMKIYRAEGLLSFYKGYVPNLLGIIPYAGIDLTVYETLKKRYLRNHDESEDPGVLVLLACGTASSTCGQIASYPLALVRTRLQAAAVLQQQAGGTDPATLNMRSLFRSIIQQEGFLGLYRGIAPNFLKVAPAVSISYVVYEKCRTALGVTMT
ncbi:calcium-binding mitochondrial carrier protein SCaMC-1-B-like [Pollicipes pollicipes]|uniref:calcium-binding mitochondrial carrier protein SCaMC-1-B-like n=1 Tax=Pollicipes pollicipes TaxID=41117 RepID=UPI0018856DA2|nr:calcium-binding mitochondrial carrier protein SCaMC-1-B-like [Pollicipes pollicipes]